jgi:hypothetical protein
MGRVSEQVNKVFNLADCGGEFMGEAIAHFWPVKPERAFGRASPALRPGKENA